MSAVPGDPISNQNRHNACLDEIEFFENSPQPQKRVDQENALKWDCLDDIPIRLKKGFIPRKILLAAISTQPVFNFID
jgi:hypothetical protein